MIGEPKPTVSWKRAKGEMNDPAKFQNKYDPVTNEHTLEVGILTHSLTKIRQQTYWKHVFSPEHVV